MNKIALILIPIMLVGGGVFAAMQGMINVPGLTPEKKKAASQAEYVEGSGDSAASKGTSSKGNSNPGDESKSTVPANPTDKSDKANTADPSNTAVASSPSSPTVDPKKPPPPKPDEAAGRQKLAKLWNEVDTAKLLEIMKDWPDDDLAKQLAAMDTAKVAEILSTMKDPARAAKLSKAIRAAASESPKAATP
jgi:hypothetical protein